MFFFFLVFNPSQVLPLSFFPSLKIFQNSPFLSQFFIIHSMRKGEEQADRHLIEIVPLTDIRVLVSELYLKGGYMIQIFA